MMICLVLNLERVGSVAAGIDVEASAATNGGSGAVDASMVCFLVCLLGGTGSAGLSYNQRK